MARRPTSDPALDLDRIRKQKDKPAPRARLRIMIAGDANRPIRTITLPRSLPKLISLGVGILLLLTVILAWGAWMMRDTLAALERRVRAMVLAADSVALGPGGEAVTASTVGLAGPVRSPGGDTGTFLVQSANTGEELEVRLNLSTGEVDAATYKKLRHLMRCLRTTAETPIDPRLIDLLYRISQRTRQKIILVSGFRAPMFSTAALSYHTRGMAADIRIPGMTALMVRDMAESMGVHGIGYYPVSEFVHVDVRDDNARWTDYGKNREDAVGTEHGPDKAAPEPTPADE